MIETNPYQTKLTDELLDSLNKEVRGDLMDILTNVEFVKRLIDPKRKYAKDLDRDEQGRVIIDLVNPHIITDMDYFTAAADHFRKYGCYTKLMPNPNPQSEYGQWLKRELTRCWRGMVRESDGEWITGDMYFYLNYFPIIQTKIVKGTKIGDRVTDFPEVWEGVYWRFHYWHQARYGGIYDNFTGAKHCVEIASRGKAHPYSQDVITPNGWKLWSDVNIGSKLYGDNGEITTVIDIPFDEDIEVYKITLKDGREVFSSKEHLWNVNKHGWKDDRVEVKSLEEIMFDYKCPRKITERNPGGFEYVYSIPSNKSIEFDAKEVFIDPYVMGLLLGDGTFRHSEYVNTVAFTAHKDDMEIYRDHIPYKINTGRTKFGHSISIEGVSEYLKSVGLFMQKSEGKFIPQEYKYNSKEVRLNILKGLMDTDGGLSNGRPTYTSVSEQLIKDVAFICRSLGYNCNYTKQKAGYKKNGIYKPCLDCYCLWIYTDDKIFKLPRKLNLIAEYTGGYSKSKRDKTRIVNIEFSHIEKSKCVTVDNESHSYLIGDFVQTHNSKSYSFGSKLTKNFVVGESEIANKKVKSLIAAYSKEYLVKDGTLNKFIDGITHCAKFTQFPAKRLKASMSDLNWRAGFLDADTGLEMGTLNEVLGVAIKDDSDKLRGKRSSWMGYEEFAVFPQFLNTWQTSLPNVQEGNIAFGQASACGCVCSGTRVWTSSGECINIEDIKQDDGIIGFKNGKSNRESITYIQDYTEKECVEISTVKRTLKCSIDHPILCRVSKSRRTADYKSSNDRDRWYEYEFIEAGKLNSIRKNDFIMIAESIDIFSDGVLFDPYLVGLLIGDGSYGFDKTPRLSNCDSEVLSYVESRYDTVLDRPISITKDGRAYKEIRIKNICQELRRIGIYGQVKNNKRLPVNYMLLTKRDAMLLIAGLFDSDGTCYYTEKKNSGNKISITQSSVEILNQLKDLLYKFGIQSVIRRVEPNIKEGRKDKNAWYTLNIEDHISLYNFGTSIKLKIEYKIKSLDLIVKKCLESDPHTIRMQGAFSEKVLSVSNIGVNQVYNLTAGDSNTYIANGIITHNTGGSEGADFQGALEMLLYPEGYNVYALPNFWDKGSNGKKKTIFFYPGYVNSKGFYNKDGVSDIVGALISEIEHRVNLKYNSSDPLQLTRRKAETAFTIQDAIMRRDGSLYPSDKLNDVINEINMDPKYTDDMWIGRLKISKEGIVEYKPDNDLKYITEFPHKDNKIEGAICIKHMPIKDSSGKVPRGRYIAGSDVYDDDSSDTLSLFSMYILDLWTDELVFEYTGRPMFADEAYENCRLALLMYNAECNYENNKKGLFAYFSKMNSLYLLCDTLDFLKDKEMVKSNMYGNKAKGTGNYGSVAPYARRCIRDWLLKPEKILDVKMEDGNLIEVERTTMGLQKIWSKPLLQELAMWNDDGNFDRHDALAMLMLIREDKLRLLGNQSPKDAISNRDLNYLGQDEFFTKNYRRGKKDRDDE